MWDDPQVRDQVEEVPAEIEAMQKLMKLVRGLVSDPTVQRQIQADSVLRDLWADPAVRQQIGGQMNHQ